MERKTWKRQAAFEREAAPSPELFASERILGIIEASLGDIGLLGFLLRRQERLVVTTHRIFQYSTTFASANLRSLELAKVETIEAGSKFNVVQLVAGLVLLAGAVFLLSNAVFQPSQKMLFIITSLLSALAGSFAIMTAAQKVLQVSCSGLQNSIRLPVVRLGASESKSFVDLVSGAVRNLHKATAATTHQAGRKSAETLKNSKNGDDGRARAPRATQSPASRSYQESNGAWNESLNGQDASYQTPQKSTRKTASQPRQEFGEAMPNTPSNNNEDSKYRTSPSREGWYRNSSRDRGMYIE
ncbi:MAG: hypothetical protein ACREOI_21980 [bacterium]